MIWNVNPVALKIGSLQIRWYGLIYVLNFFLVQFFGWKIWQKNNLNQAQISKNTWEDFCFYAFLFGIAGGRIGEFLFYNPSVFFTNPLQVFKIWEGGMSIHGGLLGAILAIIFLAKKHKISALKIFDAMAIPMAAALGFGRIANYINGEIVGIPTNKTWGIIFPHVDELLRHPVQLYEALAMFLLAGILFFWWKFYKNFTGKLLSGFLFGYGFFRFIVEFWKQSPGFIGDFKTGQVLSFGMILIGIFVWFKSKKND